MSVFSLTATALSVCYPAINAFALMLLAIPATYLLYKELQM